MIVAQGLARLHHQEARLGLAGACLGVGGRPQVVTTRPAHGLLGCPPGTAAASPELTRREGRQEVPELVPY